jgi:glycosyltransferase involved in cell wall biosynthesis
MTMKLCLTLEHRFLQTPDKRVWTITQCPYEFYREYLEVFDSVRVISRVFPVSRVEPNFLPVEGPGVEFYAMPGYKGPFGFLAQFANVRQRARHAVPAGSAVILRVHSQVANSVEDWLTRRSLPYGLEVTADPYDVLSPAANRHPVAPVARRYFTRRMQRQCQHAVAVSYVTQDYLQRRYPPASQPSVEQDPFGGKTHDARQCVMAVSDVSLSSESFVSRPRTALHDPSCLRIVFVGTLGSFYKGPDLLVEAIAICKRQGIPARVRFIGSGQQMGSLQKRCVRLGVEEEVEFVGSVTAGEPVRHELDQADLFVLPSRAEGVPRAMLEAMARGLPCLGSAIGGIPELLHEEDLVSPDNPAALAKAITEVFSSRAKVERMSARNLSKAAEYATVVLADRRREFYRAVKELTTYAYASRRHDWYQTLPSSLHESQTQ